MRTLYLCYFGLREPLVQSQVLPYLRQLAAAGIDVSLLTFEPLLKRRWTREALEEEEARLAAEGIRWFHKPYHKRPSVPATLYDVLAGAWFAARLARRLKVDVLHARAHIAMAMALAARRLTNCRLVFDLRGLVAEEYVDAGIWQEGSLPFRAMKGLERAGLRKADQVIVLTRRVRDWLVGRGLVAAEKVEVIPCCVDLARFTGESAPAENFEVVYAGSVVGLYMLEEMARFFLEVKKRRPSAFFRVLTVTPPEAVAERLRRVGLGAEEFWAGAARPEEVPEYLRRARLGVSFRKPTFSQIAASPTKIAEYLSAGLPVVSNAGTGDVDDVLLGERVGVTVSAFDEEALAEAAARALALADEPGVRARCAEVARRVFDLATVGARGYRNVYERLGAKASTPEAAPKVVS